MASDCFGELARADRLRQTVQDRWICPPQGARASLCVNPPTIARSIGNLRANRNVLHTNSVPSARCEHSHSLCHLSQLPPTIWTLAQRASDHIACRRMLQLAHLHLPSVHLRVPIAGTQQRVLSSAAHWCPVSCKQGSRPWALKPNVVPPPDGAAQPRTRQGNNVYPK